MIGQSAEAKRIVHKIAAWNGNIVPEDAALDAMLRPVSFTRGAAGCDPVLRFKSDERKFKKFSVLLGIFWIFWTGCKKTAYLEFVDRCFMSGDTVGSCA